MNTVRVTAGLAAVVGTVWAALELTDVTTENSAAAAVVLLLSLALVGYVADQANWERS